MIDNQERRASGAARVPVEALVEICGNDPGIPAFEAEALDVSGQGMHLRTAYLPERGAPLVCRFEDRGREIVVEGEVAWRKEEARGGEFGIRFTALDSGSVEALKDLCDSRSELPPEATDEGGQVSPPSEAGSRVRLHIDGLGSPMKARVRDVGSRQVQVGSNLEFLKVGRRLEIEDLEFNEKRRAHIDSVNVVIDPATQVPQLVVALRYDDLPEATPEPSVIDAESPAPRTAHAPEPATVSAGRASTSPDLAPVAAEDEVMEEVDALRNRFDTAAVRAGAVAKSTGAVLARAGASAAQGVSRLFQGASAKVIEFRNQRAAAAQPRRTTAPPPTGALSQAGARLRPQSSAAPGDAAAAADGVPDRKARVKKIALTASLAVFLAAVSALALHHKRGVPPGATAVAASHAVAVGHDVKQVDDQGNPIQGAAAPVAQKGTPTANVPLFGPTPMATLEPAPLGPAPQLSASAAAAPNAEEAAELAAAKAAPVATDQVFVDDQPPAQDKAHKKVNPSDVAPWGRGHLHRPIVYKLPLDGPGSAIEGAVRATGFTVLIPDRKVKGSVRAIARRDHRIAHVAEENTAHGAQITFQFRDSVPAYRVRLRHHYVEILISAPESKARRSSHHVRSKHHRARH
jgi:PilZ domain